MKPALDLPVGLRCPHCGCSVSSVLDMRHRPGGVRRRRTYKACGQRFTTYEIVYTPSQGTCIGPIGRRSVVSGLACNGTGAQIQR